MKYIILIFIAFGIEIVLGKKFLKWVKKNQYVQPLLEIGPDHQKKHGTPTMGGLSFVGTIVIVGLIATLMMYINGQDITLMILGLVVLVAYGYIGYRDDILKIKSNDNAEGLSPKQKMLAQFCLGIIVVTTLVIFKYQFVLNIYTLNTTIDLASTLGTVVYGGIVIFLLLAVSNSTNITDGLDGLLSSIYIVSLLTLLIIAISQGNVGAITIIVIVIGALVGFLVFNLHPAMMFMGDTGSLALGALLVIIAIMLKTELLIALIGFVYLLETLSIFLQISYFKYTKKREGEGKRIFLMAPFHHHLEKKGKSEKAIVLSLCLVQVLASALALIIYFR